jgi:PilZ domain
VTPTGLFDEDKVSEAQERQRKRGAAFGATAASNIRDSRNCRFSLLPHEALARLASGWYEASAQAMLNGNYAPISEWIHVQAQLSADQRFEPEDVFQLLRACRSTAVEKEKWSEDIFSVVDDVINESLVSVAPEIAWHFSPGLNYLAVASSPAAQQAPARDVKAASATALDQPEEEDPWGGWMDDRRDFARNRLRLPIRVRIANSSPAIEEVTHTQNVSRSGLCFVTESPSYSLKMALKITYPYWTEKGAINRDYKAKIVRMSALRDGRTAIAVEFTESLGPRR